MQHALVIIDVQAAILEGACTPSREATVKQHLDEVVGRLAELRDRARAANVPVFMVQHDGGTGDPLEAGTPGWAWVEALEPGAGDILIHKQSCDAFFETGLAARLTALGVNCLTVGGCQTQYCIDTSVRRAVSLGFDVRLIGDGHSTGDQGTLCQNDIVAHHNATLDRFSAGRAAVRVMPASEASF